MNKTEKLTRVKFITKWWNRVGTVDVDYESKKLGEMFADLDQLLQAEREECAKDILNQYYDICKKDDSGLSAYKMQKLIKYIITIRDKK